MRKSRMFEGLRTWNPYFGCYHNCYSGGCWAKRRLAHRIGRAINCKMCYEFTPHLHPKRLKRVPRDPRIFVVAHGDLFGWWVPKDVIERILEVCRSVDKEIWFFETKNPRRYFDFIDKFPENTVLSTTIETNREYPFRVRGYTPPPVERFHFIHEVRVHSDFPVHVSIEPIMDFDLDIMVRWIRLIKPFKVSVGYDSLHNGLPEPPLEKTLALIKELEKFTVVERKQMNPTGRRLR